MSELRDLAEKVFEEMGNSTDALEAVEAAIRTDPALLEEAVRRAASEVLADAQRQARHSVARDPVGPKKFTSAFQSSVQYAAGKFLNWPMMDGTPLGSADKEHLLRDAVRYQSKAEGMKKNMLFLRLVAGKMRAGQQVKDVYQDDELARLMRRAEREQAASAG